MRNTLKPCCISFIRLDIIPLGPWANAIKSNAQRYVIPVEEPNNKIVQALETPACARSG